MAQLRPLYCRRIRTAQTARAIPFAPGAPCRLRESILMKLLAVRLPRACRAMVGVMARPAQSQQAPNCRSPLAGNTKLVVSENLILAAGIEDRQRIELFQNGLHLRAIKRLR